MKLLYKTLIFLSISLIVIWFSYNFLAPAYGSYKGGCVDYPKGGVDLDSDVSGYFQVNSNGTDTNWTLQVNYEEDSIWFNKTLVHENCHLNQFKNKRYYACSYKIGYILNEVECYWKSYWCC